MLREPEKSYTLIYFSATNSDSLYEHPSFKVPIRIIATKNPLEHLEHRSNIYLSGIKDYSTVSKLSFTIPFLLNQRVFLLNRHKTRFYPNPAIIPKVPKPLVEVIYLPKKGTLIYRPQEFKVLVTPNSEGRIDTQFIYLLKTLITTFPQIKFLVIYNPIKSLGKHPNLEYRNLVYYHSILELFAPTEKPTVLLDLFRHNHFERIKDCHLTGIFPLIFIRNLDITTQLSIDYLNQRGYKNFYFFKLEKLMDRLLELYTDFQKTLLN